MIKTYKTPLLTGLIMLFLTSCFSPQPIIKIQPDLNENIFWHNGLPIAEAKKDSTIIRAAFSHIYGRYLIFDVEIFNERDQPFLIRPEDMSIAVSENFIIPVMDPEKVIFSMEMENARTQARQKNAAIVAGVLVATAVVATAVTSNNLDTAGDDIYDDHYDLGVVHPAFNWGCSFHNQAVLSTASNAIPRPTQLDFWTGFTLRKTTLESGYSIRGLVAFPWYKASDLLLRIPLGNTEFEFLFKQQQYQP